MKSTTARRPKKAARRDQSTAGEKDGAWEWIKAGGTALLLYFVISTFIVKAYTIPSGSMEDTLLVGDYLMANNAIYGATLPFTDIRLPGFREPRHGDIVVFRPAYNDPVIDVVKRVIGEPGDTIQMIDRVVYRNGERLEEPYAEPTYLPDEPLQRYGPAGYQWHLAALPAEVNRESYRPTRDTWGPLVVPEGHYFLMGDNRDQSLDSRYMGFIPREVIRGKAIFLYYSIDKTGDAPFPRFLTAARWDRLGQVLR